MNTFDSSFGYWLSGFIDGEGSFGIERRCCKSSDSFGNYKCFLRIKLRCDDRLILEEIQRRTGLGCIYDNKARGPSRLSCVWCVANKNGCVAMVDTFDQYPLRAKKARDYAIWREAVIILRNKFPGDCRVKRLADRRQLEVLYQALRDVRRYSSPEEQVIMGIDPFVSGVWNTSVEPDFVG